MAVEAQTSSAQGRAGKSRPWLGAALVVVATVLAYADSFGGAFLLDDRRSLLANPSIAHLWPLGPVLTPAASSATVSGRPFANLTFALDRAVHGLDRWGYHAVNVAIHLAAALALFGLVRRTLSSPVLRPRWQAAAVPVATVVALWWAVHPLQTEAVTYIVQRVQSLMGCFYFVTLYAYVRAAAAPASRRWPVIAVLAALLGMATKEDMASVPVIALLYDRTFLAGTFREAWCRRRGLLLGLAATWLLVAALIVSGGGNRGGSIGFGTGIAAWDYWLTQPRAIARYLALSVWPHPLVFEYGADWIESAADVVPYAILVLGLAGAALFALGRRPVLGFLGGWFFAMLAPTSLMPGVSQLTVEHRMYVALAPLVALAVAALHRALGRRAWIASGLVAVGFGGLTAARNLDYRSPVVMWRDTVAKRPRNPLAQDNLAVALHAAGKLDAAVAHHRIAVTLAPGVAGFHYTYAATLLDAGRTAEAVPELTATTRLAPGWTDPWHDLGIALLQLERPADALAPLAQAAAAEPKRADYQYDYGTALLRAGRATEAVEAFHAAVRANPGDALAHHDLGAALAQLGRYDAALPEFEAAVRLAPSDLRARTNLANVLGALGRYREAQAQFEAVLRSDPRNAPAREGLARLRAAMGR